MNIEKVKFDCKYFQGHIPCTPNKINGAICATCKEYIKIAKKILIIKLGAIGDVIRTTPLIVAYKKKYPDAQFTWVTLFPDVLPKEAIDKIYKLNGTAILNLTNDCFDIAINLDKDTEACVLLSKVTAKEKYGFTFENNHLSPATKNANHKIITGLFDEISKTNTKSYLEEIFEICHLSFNYEEYLIRINNTLRDKWNKELLKRSSGKKIIGLNTGCGERWKTRLWPTANWITLIKELQSKGYFCMLLGGANEAAQNQIYAKATNSYYPGHYSLEEFIALSDSCDIIITQVSLMMHIAIALKKQMILFNNIFNANEFELYKRGVIMEPTSGCDCYYGNTCKRESSCMNDISPENVVKEVSML